MAATSWLVLATGCAQVVVRELDAGPPDCGAPRAIEYTCELVPTGAEGCSGPAIPWSDATLPPSGVAPIGCVVRFPFCHQFYPNEVTECRCMSMSTLEPESHWLCPL